MKLIYCLIVVALLAACSSQPVASPAPASSPAQPTSAPTSIPTEAGPAPTATLEPVAFVVPRMEVGSQFSYVDGAVLDAVPNDGLFLMGGSGDAQHEVTVSDFWIYSAEVTNQMYDWCARAGKCTPPDEKDNPGFGDRLLGNYPVVGVDWQQSSDYCAFVNGRLPTEAEWEKAASWDAAQKAARPFPWGAEKPTCDLLNFGSCVKKAASVVNYGPGASYYGALNMAGNVYEWVSDWYKADYYAASPAQDPLGPDTGTKRIYRSSAFRSDASQAQASLRHPASPAAHRNDLGFRCVVKDPVHFAPFCIRAAYYEASAVDPAAAMSKPCPDPILDAVEVCGSGDVREMVNVTVKNTSPTIVTVSGLDACNPADNEVGSAHQCKLGLTIQVNASCEAKPAGQPTCPLNYAIDPNNPNQCVSVGNAGACPAGFQYDDALKCCGIAPDSAVSAPLCTVGQHTYNGVCVDDAAGPWGPASIQYVTASGAWCPGSTSCNLRPEKCDKVPGYSFDAVRCTCVKN